MQEKETRAAYSERRQLEQYKLSVEVEAAVTMTVEDGDDPADVTHEAMARAKARAGREMRQRVEEHQMQKEIERDD